MATATDAQAGPTLNRRRFLEGSAAVGAALTLAPLAGRVEAAVAASTPLWALSATEVAGLIASGKLTAVDAVKACLARIDEVNGKLNAVVAECRERALAEAAAADALLASGKSLGPLHGVPFTVKENIARCMKLGVANLPAIYLDGKMAYSSIIPSRQELEARIRALL